MVAWAWLLGALAGAALADEPPPCACSSPPRVDHLYEDLSANCAAVRGVDALMGCMPEELRRNYTLVYESRSPQCASGSSPRIVLYSRDGRTMVSFPGDRRSSRRCASDTVDVAEWDPVSASYRPRVVRAPASGPPSFHASGPETEACASCHGADFHANWDSYPRWPGAYGSDHDRIRRGSAEARRYDAFLARSGGVDRYRFLVPSPSRDEPYSRTDDPPARAPNQNLNAAIQRRNADRIARILRESPSYARMKYRLLSGLLAGLNPALQGCQPFDEAAMNDLMLGVSEDFRGERAGANSRMRALDPRSRDFPLSTYPTRAQAARDPSTLPRLKGDPFVWNMAALLNMARSLGITDVERFFPRFAGYATTSRGGRRYTVDRTADLDGRLGKMLAIAIFRDIRAAEASASPAPPFPFSSYWTPDHAGVEHPICEHYDINNPDPDPAPARRLYGDEECRDGILEYPAADSGGPVAGAPSICARLTEAASAAGDPCPPGPGPLGEGGSDQADAVIRAAGAAANPLARCAGCHSGGTEAPVIPFGSRDSLRAALVAPGSTLQRRIVDSVRAGRMPPSGGALGSAEADRIETYLTGLRTGEP